jgi:NodT family efflux transporter outer membrane factor (OMF) lipoprotein
MSSGAQAPGAAALILLAGCAVGPNFDRPKPPAVPSYDTPETDMPSGTQDSIAAPVRAGAELPALWWQLFKSAELDQTVQQALAGSPTLQAANETLAAAREAIIVAQAGYLPKIGTSAGAQTGGEVGNGASSSGASLYSIGLNASYSFNAFGGATRRLVEQQRALADSQRYQLDAAYLTLTGDVVTEALTIASTRAQLAATLDLLADDQKNLDLTKREFEAGAAAQTDVLTAESQLASDQTSLPTLRQQLSAARHALAVLIGKTPGEWSAPDYDLKQFTLPTDVPISLPSALVRQRPDILASEAQLRADSAAIGIALAQEYPGITLSAAVTRESLNAAQLFHELDSLWNAAGTLTQPLYAGGALRAQTRAARDAFRAQAASYRGVVLEAFGQVADDLRALEHDTDRVSAFRRALRIAGDSLALQRLSYTAGKTTILQLIDAERSYSQALLGSVGADSQQQLDTVTLLVALGGGWWNSPIAATR